MTRFSTLLPMLTVWASSLVGCQVSPPPLWAEGGAPLSFSASVLTHVDGDQTRLDDQGGVWEGNKLVYALDRAGRVVDDANDPVALLDPDGQLFGTSHAYWGRIGLHNAAPPWAPEAWLRVGRDGQVVLFDRDGESVDGGRWTGCEGAVLRACTLVTHLLMLESVQRQHGPDIRFGLGFGYYY